MRIGFVETFLFGIRIRAGVLSLASRVINLLLLNLFIVILIVWLKYLLRILEVLIRTALFHHLKCGLVNVDLPRSRYPAFCRFFSFGRAALDHHNLRNVAILRRLLPLPH